MYVTESGTVVTDTLRRRRDISLDNSQWLGYDLDGIPSMDMYDPESGATDVIERVHQFHLMIIIFIFIDGGIGCSF